MLSGGHVNEIEAKRIAAVVSIIRPEWRQGLVMSVLGDERLRHRVYEDVLVAAVACYADLTTSRPGRIHEPGSWWLTRSASAVVTTVRTIADDDCDICTKPQHAHPIAPTDPHEWVPRNAQGPGIKPTPEQRAAIDEAVAQAQAQITAAKEAATTPETPSTGEGLALEQEDA